jgi:CysZ protein
MFHDLKDGFSSYFDALGLMRKYRLWKYAVWAGLVSLVIVFLGGFSSYALADDLASLLTGWLGFLPEEGIFSSIAEWLSGILILLVFLIFYKYIVLIVMAPFMSPLSEELENRLNDDYEPIPFSLSLALKDLWRGLRINIRNLFKELMYTLLLFIASFIPGAAVITAPLIFIVQSYYAGFGNMDYYLERHLNVSESARFVRDFKGLAIGNGIVFILLLMIPVVGLFLAPTLATAAATQECEKRYSFARS